MRFVKPLVVIPALALLAMSCGPRHPCMSHHGEPCKGGLAAMAHGCGPESCTYQSRCFSDGAIRSNEGACQVCRGGKWATAIGCHECGKGCSDCGGKKIKKPGPCQHGGGQSQPHEH